MVRVYVDSQALKEAMFARRFDIAVLGHLRASFLDDLVKEGFTVEEGNGRTVWGFAPWMEIRGDKDPTHYIEVLAKRYALEEYLAVVNGVPPDSQAGPLHDSGSNLYK